MKFYNNSIDEIGNCVRDFVFNGNEDIHDQEGNDVKFLLIL